MPTVKEQPGMEEARPLGNRPEQDRMLWLTGSSSSSAGPWSLTGLEQNASFKDEHLKHFWIHIPTKEKD